MKLPGIDARDLNPVHCCVCVNLGWMDVKADTLVKGYAVCVPHSVLIDSAESLPAAIEACRSAGHGR